MLSMSSGTIESYGSREMTHEYGYSRSSTPDSSASSRLAAQLERSAYRRSRSKTRRKQNSKQNDVDSLSRKPSRSKRLKQQQRSQSYEQDEWYRMNGAQNPSIGRALTSDEEQESRGIRIKSADSKGRRFDEATDGRVLTAQPVSASSKMNGHDDFYHLPVESPTVWRSENSTKSQGRRGQARKDITQNGLSEVNASSLDRTYVSGDHKADTQIVCENQFEHKKHKSVNVSRVRFEESWEEGPSKKSEYKVREASGISVREDAVVDYKRSENLHAVVNGNANTLDLKEKTDVKLYTSSKTERPVKGKASVKPPILIHDQATKVKTDKDVAIYPKGKGVRKHDIPSRLDGLPQGRPEVNRAEESKPLGLRQLIKIHEIQIAEVAKSAAAMKRPVNGKAHEGRLVKVKIVPEFETKQSPVKHSTAKVTFAGNKTSSDKALSRKKPSGAKGPSHGEENLSPRSESSLNEARTTVKPKRHTVELRTKPLVQSEQKRKRHTAIGLVGFDYEKHNVPRSERSPRGAGSKMFFTSDSDAEIDYMRKQYPGKQLVDEKIKKSDEFDLDTSKPTHGINKRKESNEEENDSETDEVPPARPPLPKNFYSSTEERLMRPPLPVYKDDFDTVPVFKSNGYLPTADAKPGVNYVSKPDVEHGVANAPTDSFKRNSGYVSTEDLLLSDEPVPKTSLNQHVLSGGKQKGEYVINEKFKPNSKSTDDPVSKAVLKPNLEYALTAKPNTEYGLNETSKQKSGYEDFKATVEQGKAELKSSVNCSATLNGKPTASKLTTKSKGDVPTLNFKPNNESGLEYIQASPLRELARPIALSSSLPAIHVSTAIVQSSGADILAEQNIPENDHVLGKTRTTREMYEERLARINLVPLEVSERHLNDRVASLCSSIESFAVDPSCNLHNLNKSEYLVKLKTCTKQMQVLTKQKEDLEKNFELERRDWKRKYEEQQKVANAYQKLEDRYRRQVQELQEALKLCTCSDVETKKSSFLGQSG